MSNFPDCYGSWPGALGQYLRGIQLPTNSYRQTTGANSANNKGTCK
jgi:hypothetical protein